MDRVRDLVAAGGVSVVLAQDRDRFAREPAYHYLLKREFEEYGTKIRALNDRGDESPEGELTDGILDQLQKVIPLFREVNPLQFRELMLESNLTVFEPGAPVFRINEYTNSLYTVFAGSVEIQAGPFRVVSLMSREAADELGLDVGVRAVATVKATQVSVDVP